jgi:hypothetical protein
MRRRRIVMARHRPRKARSLPPLLVRLIEAAEDAGLTDHAKALRECGSLALWASPARGVFITDDEEVGPVIERIAKEHLGLVEARKEFRRELDRLGPLETIDPVESAHNQILSVSDEAYFYLGLAFGVTLASFP